MMFKSAYACILVYMLSSGVLNYVIAASGLFSPLVLLFGLVVVLGFALMLKNVKACDFFVTAFVTFLAVYVVLTFSITLDKYIYHNAEVYKIVFLVLLIGLIGLFVNFESSAYLLKLFSTILSVLFLFVLALSFSNARFDSFVSSDLPNKTNLFMLIINSIFAFLPLLLPILKKDRFSIKPIIICGLIVLIYSLVLQLTVPGFVVAEDKNIFLEMSKNISLGKFFQRMEFVSTITLCITTLCIILYLFSMIRSKIDEKFTLKSKRLLLTFACIIFVSTASIIGVGDSASLGLIKSLSLVSVVLAIMFSVFNRYKKQIITLALSISLIINLSACMNYNEIDKLKYPLIIAIGSNDSTHNNFYFRTESTTFNAAADSISSALKTINAHSVKQLDLSQLGLVILSNDSYEDIVKVIEEIQTTDIHNSVLIAVTSDSAEEIKQADYSVYSGISEYLGEYKSKIGEYDFLDKTAYSAYVSSKTLNKTITLAKLRFESKVPLLDGAMSISNYDKVEITNKELNLIKYLKQNNMVDYEESIKISGYEAKESDVNLIYSLYNKTLDDVFDLDYCNQLRYIFDKNKTIFNNNDGIEVVYVK